MRLGLEVIGWVLLGVLTVLQWALILRAVLSWIQAFRRDWTPRGIMLVFAEAIYTVTDPVLRPFKKLIRPLRLGSFALDMGFLVVFLLVMVCIQVVWAVFF